MTSGAMTPDAWRAAGRTMSWRGLRVFYRDSDGDRARNREPLLLLHGFPTSSWDWAELWDDLADAYRVVALDYVGFGFSAKPPGGPYAVFSYADQAEAVLDHLGIPHAHLLAHDLGDTVAQELLARDRERATSASSRVRSVMFLNGGVFPELHRPRAAQKLLASPVGFAVARAMPRRLFERGLAEVFGPHTQPSRPLLDGFYQCASCDDGLHNYHRLIGYMAERPLYRDRWVATIEHPRIPTAFAIGHRDPVSGAHVAERLHAIGARVTDLPDIGHYPQCEAPGAIADAYSSFRAAF
jgi:pimeloyl-ACP methyl ester carboxylesterase|nr:alpha/beta hydrolase [Kofleriaceae bacterium]